MKKAPYKKNLPLTISGKTWRMSKLTLEDYGELEEFLRGEIRKIADTFCEGKPVEIQIALQKEAMADARRVQVGTEDFNRLLLSPFGVTYMLFLSLRKEHPDVTLEGMDELLQGITPQDVERLHAHLGITPDPTKAGTPTAE